MHNNIWKKLRIVVNFPINGNRRYLNVKRAFQLKFPTKLLAWAENKTVIFCAVMHMPNFTLVSPANLLVKYRCQYKKQIIWNICPWCTLQCNTNDTIKYQPTVPFFCNFPLAKYVFPCFTSLFSVIFCCFFVVSQASFTFRASKQDPVINLPGYPRQFSIWLWSQNAGNGI